MSTLFVTRFHPAGRDWCVCCHHAVAIVISDRAYLSPEEAQAERDRLLTYTGRCRACKGRFDRHTKGTDTP